MALQTVRAGFECLPLDKVQPGEQTLKALYDGPASDSVQFSDLDFPVKVLAKNDRLQSVSVYKYSLKVMQDPFAERAYKDGSVDFGVLDCRIGADGVYILRRHLKAAEWCAPLDGLIGQIDNSEGSVAFSKNNKKAGFVFAVKNDKLVGPFDQISPNWDKLSMVTKNDQFEFRKSDVAAVERVQKPTAGAMEKYDRLYFRSPIGEVASSTINLLNLAYGFNEVHVKCFIQDGYYYGLLTRAFKRKALIDWRFFLKNAKKDRLDTYLKMAEQVQHFADYGYVHNSLASDQWLSLNNQQFAFYNFECAQPVDHNDDGCGNAASRFYLRSKSGARVNPRTDVYAFALNIVNIEAGKPANMFEIDDAFDSKIEIEGILAQDNAKEPTHHFVGLAKKTLASIWGPADESVIIRNGNFGKVTKDGQGKEVFTPADDVNLTSAILAIVREYAGDMTVRGFRRYLEALKERTQDRVLV